ncbi:aldose 1-epimerase [Rhizobium sp. BK418]|uniref:aldose 1-epimerase n=1 Tax=Rhizobium sp. BK418 TaxID=2512120 RepID=UPI00104EC65A|nr:aldose 1-epimerase [Rhizobium sp. BK418]TCS03063.1 aldose 1-epimerase [Rhizobium sp. BK418]
MTIVDLQSGPLSLRVSSKGGLVLGFWKEADVGRVPLLRPAPSAEADALSSSCYPLIPFGNRVKGNRFAFEGIEYRFEPNTKWDKHYLHGEGWQADWSINGQTQTSVEMSFLHRGGNTPYAYRASQGFVLNDASLTMTLTVENLGERAMPFGLGWHPYFPMTPETTLQARSEKFWTEVDEWLPGERTDIPVDLDFSKPAELPHRWVNNGFEDWNGEARIAWPERRTALRLSADPIFKHAFVFVSDTAFDPNFECDYFCFEPMTHLANGHNLPDLGGLKVLGPGGHLSGSVRLHPENI